MEDWKMVMRKINLLYICMKLLRYRKMMLGWIFLLKMILEGLGWLLTMFKKQYRYKNKQKPI